MYGDNNRKQNRDTTVPRSFGDTSSNATASQKSFKDANQFDLKPNQRRVITQNEEEKSAAVASPDFSIIGLENIGNTWYMNVILQWLFHLKEFNKTFLNESYKRMLNSTQKGSIWVEYAALLKKTKEPDTIPASRSILNRRSRPKDYVSTRDLKEELWSLFSSFKGFDQHDSHEFCTTLLDQMSKELNRVTTKPAYSEIKVSSKDSLDKQAQKWFDYYK